MRRAAQKQEPQECHRVREVQLAVGLPVEESQIRIVVRRPVAAGQGSRGEEQRPQEAETVVQAQLAVLVTVAGRTCRRQRCSR